MKHVMDSLAVFAALMLVACASGGGSSGEHFGAPTDYERVWAAAIGDGKIVAFTRIGKLQLNMDVVDARDLLGAPFATAYFPGNYELLQWPGIQLNTRRGEYGFQVTLITIGKILYGSGHAEQTREHDKDFAWIRKSTDLGSIPPLSINGNPITLGVTTREQLQSYLGRPTCYDSYRDNAGLVGGLLYKEMAIRFPISPEGKVVGVVLMNYDADARCF